MRHQAIVPPARRLEALAAVVMLHAILLIVVLTSRSRYPPPVQPSALSVIALNAVAPPAQPTPPKSLSKLLDQLRPPPVPDQPREAETIASGSTATQCKTLDSIALAILASPAVVTSVLNAPPETRSIAEAIVVWNARWSDSVTAAEAPLAPVREVVRRSLETVPDSCLDEPVAGPRLVPVPAGEGTMFLVIGSGVWTWRQLLTEPTTAEKLELRGWKLRPSQ